MDEDHRSYSRRKRRTNRCPLFLSLFSYSCRFRLSRQCLSSSFAVTLLAPAVEGSFAACQGDLAVKHPLGGQKLVAKMTYLFGGPAKHGNLQAMSFSQMDVQAGHDQLMVMMLLVDQASRQFPGM